MTRAFTADDGGRRFLWRGPGLSRMGTLEFPLEDPADNDPATTGILWVDNPRRDERAWWYVGPDDVEEVQL